MSDNHFDYILENIEHERTLLLILSIIKPNLLKEVGFNNDDIKQLVSLAEKKLKHQKDLRDIFNHNLSIE